MTAAVGGLLGASSARLVYTLAGMLVILGVAMVVLTVWLIRSTRPDPEVLARLELMGTRGWRDAGTKAREAQLEALRANADADAVEGDGHGESADADDADGVDDGAGDVDDGADDLADAERGGTDVADAIGEDDETVPIVAGAPAAATHESESNGADELSDEEVAEGGDDSRAGRDDTPSKGLRPDATDVSR